MNHDYGYEKLGEREYRQHRFDAAAEEALCGRPRAGFEHAQSPEQHARQPLAQSATVQLCPGCQEQLATAEA